MDDIIFASKGNFSAVKFNQRVNKLFLHGVQEHNTGIYQCQLEFDVIATHQMSLQKGECNAVI